MSGLKEVTRVIPASGFTRIAESGNTVFIKRSSSPLLVTMRVYQRGGSHAESRLEMTEGDSQLNQQYDSLEIQNPTAVDLSVTVVYGTGEYKRPGGITVLTHATNADFTIPAATATQLNGGGNPLAGTVSSRIRSLPSNTSTIRVGDSFVSNTQGFPLEPGEWIDLPVGADVWVYSQIAGQVISVTAYN